MCSVKRAGRSVDSKWEGYGAFDSSVGFFKKHEKVEQKLVL